MLAPADNKKIPRTETTVKSSKTLTRLNAVRISVSLDYGKPVAMTNVFQNIFDRLITNKISNVKDEFQGQILDEASEFPVRGTDIEQPPQIYYMVTGQTNKTNRFLEFLTAWILIQHDPSSHRTQQIQNLSSNF